MYVLLLLLIQGRLRWGRRVLWAGVPKQVLFFFLLVVGQQLHGEKVLPVVHMRGDAFGGEGLVAGSSSSV
jgi:hypothetical protein